jgi:hypothetical protein
LVWRAVGRNNCGCIRVVGAKKNMKNKGNATALRSCLAGRERSSARLDYLPEWVGDSERTFGGVCAA